MSECVDIATLVCHEGPLLLLDGLLETGPDSIVCEVVVRSDGLFDTGGPPLLSLYDSSERRYRLYRVRDRRALPLDEWQGGKAEGNQPLSDAFPLVVRVYCHGGQDKGVDIAFKRHP